MQKIKQDISLGNNIRTLRKQSHLTQEQIVARMQLQGIRFPEAVIHRLNVAPTIFVCPN